VLMPLTVTTMELVSDVLAPLVLLMVPLELVETLSVAPMVSVSTHTSVPLVDLVEVMLITLDAKLTIIMMAFTIIVTLMVLVPIV